MICGEDDVLVYDRGILDCVVVMFEDILESDCIIFGLLMRYGCMVLEMSVFFDCFAVFYLNGCALKGKIGSLFIEVGGVG